MSSQHFKEPDHPDYYSSNSGMPHDPSSSGYMATHSTFRFLAMHEQTALLVGEGKHGVWRFQENGFIRVYREKGKEGIPQEKREEVLDLDERVEVMDDTREQDEEINRLFEILQDNYQNIDPNYNFTFDYAFGDEVFKAENGSRWLNWIDLPIFHGKFGKKYEDHVPIDLPTYYCQVNL